MLKRLWHIRGRYGFNDGSESDYFVNLFHDQFPMRRHQNMEPYEDNDRDLKIKFRFQNILK